jgi:hypothetical protein
LAVKQLVQLVAELQVWQREGQAEQTATPASKKPVRQLQLLVLSLVVLSEQVLQTVPTEQDPHW